MLSGINKLYTLFSSKGFKLYEVGGCVRDTFMGIDPHDYDFATDATPQEMLDFKSGNVNVIDTGSQYGTVTFHIDNEFFEVTTFRSDSEYSDGRRPDKVTFSKNILQDLARRDFTVNAIAIRLEDEKVIDPYNGRQDIKDRVLRTVGEPEERFREDGLRILRAIRFKFKFGLYMEDNTYNAILNNWNLLDNVSQERITSEFLQILEHCNIDSQQDALLMDGLIKYLIPEAWYKNTYDSNFWRYEAIRGFSDTECRLAYLLRESKSSAENTCKRLKLSNDFTKDVCDTLKAFELVAELSRDYDTDGYIARKLVSSYGTKNALRAWQLFADDYGITPYDYNDMYALLEIAHKWPVTLKDLAVKGDDLIELGYEGKEVGGILNRLLEYVLDDPTRNEKEELLKVI